MVLVKPPEPLARQPRKENQLKKKKKELVLTEEQQCNVALFFFMFSTKALFLLQYS
jgi:hypothetical protein